MHSKEQFNTKEEKHIKAPGYERQKSFIFSVAAFKHIY